MKKLRPKLVSCCVIILLSIAKISFAQPITIDWIRMAATIDASIQPRQIEADSERNLYIAGYFGDKVIFGTDTLFAKNPPNTDLFIAKYDSTGNCLWSKSFYSNSTSYILGLDIDKADNLYICGEFSGDSLHLGTITVFNLGVSNCAFAAKLDANGQTIWATASAGQSAVPSIFDDAQAITVDDSGNVYMTGGFASDTFYIGQEYLTMQHGPGGAGVSNMYVAKLSPSGDVIWMTGESQGTDPGFNTGTAITTDSEGNVYFCGVFEGTKTIIGQQTLFVFDRMEGVCARLNPQNGQPVWARAIRGYSQMSNTYEYPTGIFLDDDHNLYTGGKYDGVRCDYDSIYQILTPVNSQNPLGPKIFLFKLDPLTGLPYWGKGFCDNPGGGVYPQDWSIHPASGRIALAGNYYGTPTFGTITLPASFSPTNEGFFLEMDTSGNVMRGLNSSGALHESAMSICYDASGRMAGTGFFSSNSVQFGNQLSLQDQAPQDFFYDLYVFRETGMNTVGVQEQELPSAFLLYPNPASDEMIISRKNGEGPFRLRIYDNQGRLIFEKEYEQTEKQVLISLNQLSSGHYQLHYSDSQGQSVQSFIRL